MVRCVLVLSLSVAAGQFTLQAKAQTCGAGAQSPIATDRPQITNSSIVVPCGSVQFENGFQQTSNGGQRSYDLPETSVRLGITNKTELRLSAPDYFFDVDTGAGFASGAGDLSPRLQTTAWTSAGIRSFAHTLGKPSNWSEPDIESWL
jgi:hypothetical protein